MFEEIGGGGGKKKKWILIGVGTGLIAIFLVLRNSMQRAAAVQTADSAGAPEPLQVTDMGGYPDMTGGISGTGMDQTLATYLAVADQNTAVQMGGVTDVLHTIQTQMNTNNQNLQDQITAMNHAQTIGAIAATPSVPATITTPATTAHPAPTSITHVVQKGETLSGIATAQYGKQPAYAKGIKQVAALNKISNVNKILPGQKILLPAKLS
jgi:nucleoid-associated protein YgaU